RGGLRLDQVVTRSQLDTCGAKLRLVVRGEDDDGEGTRGGLGSKSMEQVQAAHAGKADVDEDQVGRVLGSHPQGGLAVAGQFDRIAVELQLQLVHARDLRIVLD